ncbi:MAG TPA: hypothetical protein VMT74_10160 [Gaiellaceae bacterium]|nr:hypothetical protein [Gaiellaceae bacterium]
MRRSKFAAALTAAVALSAAVASGAAAATLSPSYQVAGFAFGASQGTASSFTGFATGSLGDRGLVRATVVHDPLAGCSTVGTSCAVTGGTLNLNSNNGSSLAGTFNGGSITLSAQAPGCGRQQYTLDGWAAVSAGNTVELNAVLTTLRVPFRGGCLTLATSVQGTLAFATVAGG